MDEVGRGDVRYSVIVPDEGHEPVGSVCIWEHPDDDTGEAISEIGWMVLPKLALMEPAAPHQTFQRVTSLPGNPPGGFVLRVDGKLNAVDVLLEKVSGQETHGLRRITLTPVL